MDLAAVCAEAQANGCRTEQAVPMAALTTMRIGGPADLLIGIPDTAAASAVLRSCRDHGVPYLWLGNGSNLLVGDKGLRGAVLRFEDAAPTVAADGRITCSAGTKLSRLCRTALDNGLTGLEFAYGIPGTVGGAVYMNAGAYDGEMAQVLHSARCLDPDGTVTDVPAEQLELSYRHSALMENGRIVAQATVSLRPGDPAAIEAKMNELLSRRREKQPLEYPSAGSFFKRPAGYFAGALIQQAGMKGYQVGGAQISEKHAGFVINRGGATADDVRRLCADVQKAVYALAGVSLEPEVRFVGEF